MLPTDTVCSIDYNKNITGKVGAVIASKGETELFLRQFTTEIAIHEK